MGTDLQTGLGELVSDATMTTTAPVHESNAMHAANTREVAADRLAVRQVESERAAVPSRA
jgi:hypothetical protein